MELHLAGKKALVSGSTAGIGRAIALALASEGVVVGINGRKSVGEADKLAAAIAEAGGKSFRAMGDLSTDEGASSVAAACAEAGGVDILINNAGAYPLGGWWDSHGKDWLDTYNTDVVASVRLIQRCVPAMIERKWGRVIQISSVGGIVTPANYFPMYACAKAAQTWIAGCLASELTGTGVTANTVSPGPVATETFKAIYTDEAQGEGRSTVWADVEKDYVQRYMQDPPVQRLTQLHEIASLVAYLCSPLADTVTGSNYVMDSGYCITGWRRQPSTLPTRSAT